MAKTVSGELEKQIAYPYTINVLEEEGRNRIVAMIDERREEERKIRFEETVQVSSIDLGGVPGGVALDTAHCFVYPRAS